ncbi:MAG: zinc-binding dehydrogenase [Alphaproteobacteria bacterium]|nr:zinc-binding dehydrogenase [Alphaproteobacteria bacterium]
MKAVVLRQHGSIDALKVESDHVEKPLGPDDVRLAVRACSLNYHDVFTIRGMPGITLDLPVVPGNDIAGEIAELGAAVSGWRVGERVLLNPVYPGRGLMGEMLDGGLAERCRAHKDQLIRLPDAVSFEDAASLPVAYGTAHRMMITIGQVKAGERVLILGASGGVGTCCVMLAKMAGAEVTACASSPDKLEKLRALGADHLIDYSRTDFMKEVWRLFGKPNRRAYEGGVDVVVNYTGGNTWIPSLRALKKGGRLLVCGATAGFDPKEDLRYVWTYELQILGSNGWRREDLGALLDMVADGRMKPAIDRRYSLDDAVQALKAMEDRAFFGKLIVAPNG